MKRQWLWIAVSAFVCLSVMSGCRSKQTELPADYGEVSGGLPVLRVGFEGMTVPTNWTQETEDNGAVPITGTRQYLCGFEIDLMKQVCEEAGYQMEAYKFDWDGLMMAVPAGKVDCAISMIAPTAERDETVDFTDPYYYADTVVLVKADGTYGDVTRLDELTGAKITTMLGTLWVKQMDLIPGADKLSPMENVPAMIVALKAGTIDAFLTDRPTAEAAVLANPELKIAAFDTGKGFSIPQEDFAVAIAVPEGDTVLQGKLNDALAKITEEEKAEMLAAACEHQPLSESF